MQARITLRSTYRNESLDRVLLEQRRRSSRTRGTLTSPLIYPGGPFRPPPPPFRAVRGAAGRVPVIDF
jgi:hypothetical protein